MSKPTLLDAFCGAGGASVGYARAGFTVVGVDIEPHPDYPFELIVGDAPEVIRRIGREFDVVAGSPPCQAKTTMSNKHRGKGGRADSHPNLIAPTRDAMLEVGRPYVIENVCGARRDLRNPLLLHGGMFGLGVDRPRLFESNVALMVSQAPRPDHIVGVYGKAPDGRRLFDRADGSILRAAASLEEGAAALGIDWMSRWEDVTEAIPPAYTAFLGEQLLAHVLAGAA